MSDYVGSAARRNQAARGTGSVSIKGARAGESFASDEELEEKEAQEEYAKSQGATGLGGASKRSKPEYKAGYAAFRKGFKSKRMKSPPAKAETPGLSKLGE